MNWIDWVLIGLVALGAWQGFRRGFLVLLAETGGAIAALYLAARYHGPVVAWLEDRFGLVRTTADLIAKRIALLPGTSGGATGSIPGLLGQAGLPPEVVGALGPVLLGAAAMASPGGPEGWVTALATQLAELLWTGIAFVVGAALIGAGVRWVAGFLSGALDGAIGLPNRLAGAALGAVRNGLLLGALVGIVVPIVAGPQAGRALLGSRVAAWLGQAVVTLIGLWVGRRLPSL